MSNTAEDQVLTPPPSPPASLGPKVTEEMIDQMVDEEEYRVILGTTVTICALKMKNGFTVIGKSACVSPENFDPQLGKIFAKQDAKSKCWELLGFQLASEISEIRLLEV